VLSSDEEGIVTLDNIVQGKVSFESKTEVEDAEDQRDSSPPQIRVQTLLKENTLTKCSMAGELKRMGFSNRAIARLLHTETNVGPAESDSHKRMSKGRKAS